MRGIFWGYAHTGGGMEDRGWRMEGNWDSLSFFSFARNGIFIFGGFELGFEKMLGMQMTGAARLAAGF